MPWADGGHEVTGLKLESVAKCDWVVQLRVEDFKRHIGIAPPDIMDLIYVELAARIKAKNAGQ
jgi:mRNA-degrading endonuclease toxin of MazEF toxin-antitoxin module